MSRIQAVLKQYNIHASIQTLPSSTRSVAEAAHSLHCTEAQIGKTIVFRTQSSQEAIVVIASGTNRISESKIGELVNDTILKADASFVKEQTGYAIGGVPPFGHEKELKTFIDLDLLKFDTVYVAAGSPHSIIALKPQELSTALPHAIQITVV